MSERLVIRADVVESCLKDGQRSVSMLESSSLLAESMAQSAGPNGPLRETLQNAEGAWRIRREKMIEVLQNLVSNIRDVNAGFEESDISMAETLAGGEATAPSATGGTSPSEPGVSTGDGAPTSDLPPLSEPGTSSGQTPGAPVPAMPERLPESPRDDLGPLPEGALPSPHADIPPFARIPELADPQELINALVSRWSQLTGRPVEEILALVTAGIGVAGLIDLITRGAIPGETADGSTVGGTNSGGDGESDSSSDTDVPDPESSPGEGAADGGEASPDDSEQEAGSPADDLNGPDSVEDQEPGENDVAREIPVDPEVASDLTPAPELTPIGTSPVDLPDLAAPAAGAVGASAALDLPPLETAGSTGSTTGEAAASSLDLPDLSSSTVRSSDVRSVSVEPLPDLSVHSDGATTRSMPMASVAGGLGGGASTSAPPSTAASVGTTTSGERVASRRDALDILDDDETGSES